MPSPVGPKPLTNSHFVEEDAEGVEDAVSPGTLISKYYYQ